ncbi:hypothetical protein DE146DRAFT_665273 [Phaeosphaeria sp. MPI-PUGE-AT-0046c]|nr:hypothetical protein DE146DRAFT_665273 [Phaeosphaeria sp. MPI-PUGE-AT-0046c]
MSRVSYTAFQRHLLFFSTPTHPPRLTFLSALRAATKLGLDMPVAFLLSLSLRLMYAPFPSLLSPVNVEQIPMSKHRTQLAHVELAKDKKEYTCGELLTLLNAESKGKEKDFMEKKIDQGHVVGFWVMAASTKTNRIGRDDVEMFQKGEWEEAVVERRRERSDVLPLWRGGPIWTAGHSWAARRLLGVRVYEAKKE